MKPNEHIKTVAIAVVIIAFAGLFSSLLIDTWRADAVFEPKQIQTYMTPLFAGALGLLLALSLGVDPKVRGLGSWGARLKALFTTNNGLLTVGAVVYLLAALAGGFVWWQKDTVTPELVTSLVLIAAGYCVAAMTALARPSQGGP